MCSDPSRNVTWQREKRVTVRTSFAIEQSASDGASLGKKVLPLQRMVSTRRKAAFGTAKAPRRRSQAHPPCSVARARIAFATRRSSLCRTHCAATNAVRQAIVSRVTATTMRSTRRTTSPMAPGSSGRWPNGSDNFDADRLAEYWTMFETEPSFQSAALRIKTRLLGAGILVEGATEEFAQMVTTEFTPFASTFVDHLIVQGFCAYKVVRKGELFYPVAVPIQALKGLTIGYDRVRAKGFFVYQPTVRGARPTSVCSAVHRLHSMLTYLETLTVMSESRRAEPSVLLETSGNGYQALEQDLTTAGLDADLVREGHASAHGAVDSEVMTRLQAQQLLAKAMERTARSRAAPDAATGFAAGRDPFSNLRLFGKSDFDATRDDSRFVVAPHNTRIREQFSPPSVRSDVIDMRQRFESLVYELCGVPAVVNSKTAAAAFAKSHDVQLGESASFYAQQIHICLNDVVAAVSRTPSSELGLAFSFPSLIGVDQLRFLLESGVINNEGYTERLRLLFHMGWGPRLGSGRVAKSAPA